MKRVAALALVLAAASSVEAYTPASGFWWNPNESGTGIALEIEDKNLFMAAYVFDAQGRSTWFTSSGNLTSSVSGGATYYNVFNGSLSGFANGQVIGGPYFFPQILNNAGGPVQIVFNPNDETKATLTWGGRTLPIEKLDYYIGWGADRETERMVGEWSVVVDAYARGGDYASRTAPEKLKKMGEYFVKAAKEYQAALEGTSRLLPACEGLMAIGRNMSDNLQTYATERCLYIDPTSYYVVDELMNAAEPRWGGSEDAMKRVAAYAQEKAAINPVLSVFASNDAYYRISRMADGDAESIAVLEPAALQVPNAAYLRLVGGAYLRRDDAWKALAYLSQALRFMPDYAQESRFRAAVLRHLGESKWARADAERAARLEPANGHAQQLLGNIVRELDGPEAALPHFKRAMDDADTREYAFNDYCGSLIDTKRRDEASKCVDDLLAAYPANPEGWRQRLVIIGFDAPGSMEAMERFVALNDPKRWRYHASVADGVRKVLAARKGSASPADMFAARVIRAEALERTPTGRGYFEQLDAKAPRFMNEALTACQSAQKPGIPPKFTLVMDVQADGRVANVAVQPTNAWTGCIARQGGATFKLPPPPQAGGKAGYPMVIEFEIK